MSFPAAKTTKLNAPADKHGGAFSLTALLSQSTVPQDTQDNGHHIAIFLGYGFSDPEKKRELYDFITRTYGFIDDGGVISIISYPEDILVAGRVRLSSLTTKLTELNAQKPLTGFITAGSPEGMHAVLGSIQDSGMNLPIFSLFPQDEILGTEAGSDLVFDYRSSSLKNISEKEYTAEEEAEYLYTGKSENILRPLIQAVLYWDSIKEDPMLIPALRVEFFKETGCNLIMYTDPETGLRAKNRYVLEDIAKGKK